MFFELATLAGLIAANLAGQAASADTRADTKPDTKAAESSADRVELRPEITRAEIEAHVRFLASDELAGRCTGTPEAERAAAYLGRILARCGAEPAGDEGTFLQSVALRRTEATAAPEMTLVARTGAGSEEKLEALPGRDFDGVSAPIAAEDLKVLVARTAEEIPKEGDARAAIFVDAFESDARTWLERAGRPRGEGFALWIRPGSKSVGEPKPFRPGRPGNLARDAGKPTTPSVKIRGPLLERFRRGEIASLTLRSHVEERKVRAFNVVGRIPGAGMSEEPGLAQEAVVVSAHYDHLPPGRPREETAGTSESGAVPEDLIFNGADDDASGCAAVLEIAGALGAGRKPARTVVFLLATGEEVGLLGTEAYLDHPVVPLARTVANLNLEMIGRPDPLGGGPGKVWLTGFEKTDFGPACAQAGLAVIPDPRPAEHFYERSDNYAFVQRKVIGQTFSTYNMHADYHHPSDEADTLDYVHMEGCTRAVLEAVRLVADGKLRPKWTADAAPAAKAEPR